jgi:hypothetical protein
MPTLEEHQYALEIQQKNHEHTERLQAAAIESGKIEAKRKEHETAVSIASNALIETKKGLPVDQRAITPEEILEFAEKLKFKE